MKRGLLKAWLTAAGVVMVLLTGGTARADEVHNNHWGNAATSIAIGWQGGYNRIVMRRHSDGACHTDSFGLGTGLADDTFIFAGAGDDIIRVVPSGSSVTLCGKTLGPVNYGAGSYKLFVNTRSGLDVIFGDKNARLFSEGAEGNFVFTYGRAFAFGGGSWLFATGGQARLTGTYNDDVFCNISGEPSFAVASGSQGTDYIWGTARTMSNIEVELPAGDTGCSYVAFQVALYAAGNW